MSNGLLIAGIVCMVVAVAAGGAARLGVRIPVLNTLQRQMALFVLGLIVSIASFILVPSPAPRATDVQASADPDSCAAQPFTCLPTSASPVTFRNEAAARAAAAQNIKDNLSAAAATAAAEKLGASGNAARLCGDIQTDELSPLGKHLAALRLVRLRPGEGNATDACLKMANAFL